MMGYNIHNTQESRDEIVSELKRDERLEKVFNYKDVPFWGDFVRFEVAPTKTYIVTSARGKVYAVKPYFHITSQIDGYLLVSFNTKELPTFHGGFESIQKAVEFAVESIKNL